MKRIGAFLIGVLLIPLWAAGAAYYTNGVVIVGNTAIGLPATMTVNDPVTGTQINRCLGRVDPGGAAIAALSSGATPTASTGIIYQPGDTITVGTHADVIQLRMILSSGSAAVAVRFQCEGP